MIVRPATQADLAELAAVLNRAFSWPNPPCLDFLRMFPHLFHPGRVGDHLVGIEHDRIVAAVGVYGHDITLDGVALRGAAIGQVATVPELRGQGRMTTMLSAAIEQMDQQGLELSWLSGDRRRYGFHGWALGGSTLHYSVAERYLPAPPDSAKVQRMRVGPLIETLLAQRERLANYVDVPERELELLIDARGYGGVRLGDSWVIHGSRGDRVFFGEGHVDELGRLFAHLLTRTPTGPNRPQQLSIECADEPTSLCRAAQKFHHRVERRPSCLWRVGELTRLLGKAASMATPRIDSGSDTLALHDTDTGQAATLDCRQGQLQVRPGAELPVHRASTLGLSELCFGQGPIELALPELGQASPLRQVLPIRAHYSWFLPF